MRIDVISIFPQYFAVLDLSLIGKAKQSGLLDIKAHDLRDWTYDRHRSVDDTPYGGGAGMVMKPEPWGQALDWLLNDLRSPEEKPTLIIPSPAGEVFNQEIAEQLSKKSTLAFACGRYEGIDSRVSQWADQHFNVFELSIGDYVLNGGEVAALAVIEAVVRLIPGMVGNPESLVEESHSKAEDRMLEYPVYTKPAVWRGLEVPEVLLSGHHEKIAKWRNQQSLSLTKERRPDLLS